MKGFMEKAMGYFHGNDGAKQSENTEIETWQSDEEEWGSAARNFN
jgi:hypothetical protein